MENKMEQKHSGIGIASFITSVVSAILIFLTIVIAGVMQSASSRGMSSMGSTVLGIFILSLLFVSLVALGLGIAGLMQKERRKVFSVLGTVLSAVTLVGTILLILIGLLNK